MAKCMEVDDARAQAESPLLLLGPDAIVQIFQMCFIHDDAIGGMRTSCMAFASTCKEVRECFLGKNAVGKDAYQNYMDHFRIRVCWPGEHADKVEALAYTSQRKQQTRSKDFVLSFIRADSQNTMHCCQLHICCADARHEFNKLSFHRFSIQSVISSARIACCAIDPSGRPVHFVNSHAPHLLFADVVIKRVVLAEGVYSDKVLCLDKSALNTETKTSPFFEVLRLFHHKTTMVSMECSSDGAVCAMLVAMGRSHAYAVVWDTVRMQAMQLELTKHWEEYGMPEWDYDPGERFSCVQCMSVWFATDEETGTECLLCGFQIVKSFATNAVIDELLGLPDPEVDEDDEAVAVTPPMDCCGFFVTCHAKRKRESLEWDWMDGEEEIVLPFQRSSCKHVVFEKWSVITPTTYIDGKSSIVVYQFSNGKEKGKGQSIQPPRFPSFPRGLVVRTTSFLACQNSTIGQASHELFKGIVSACVSRNGSHMAVLAKGVQHVYSHHDPLPPGTLIFVLFTLSDDGLYYYRRRAELDECLIPYSEKTQDPCYFRISFLPCQGFVSIVYSLNLYAIQEEGASLNSNAYFVRIRTDGVRRTKPIVTTKVRQMRFAESETRSLAGILPKHGMLQYDQK